MRQLKADLLHQMAYRSTESIARAFLMREALALEGKVTIPRLIPSSPEIIAQSPDTFVDYFRVRIDPEKLPDTDKVRQFEFTDKGSQAVALHVRRGAVEFIPVPADYLREADYQLKLDSESWVALYLSSTDLGKTIADGKIKLTKGSPEEVAAVFDNFVPGEKLQDSAARVLAKESGGHES